MLCYSEMILSMSIVHETDHQDIVLSNSSTPSQVAAESSALGVEQENQNRAIPVKATNEASPVRGNSASPVLQQGTPVKRNQYHLRNGIVGAILPASYTRFRDGGAHWHRSSAVLLAGHRFVYFIDYLLSEIRRLPYYLLIVCWRIYFYCVLCRWFNESPSADNKTMPTVDGYVTSNLIGRCVSSIEFYWLVA